MELYFSMMCPFSQRVRIVISLLGIGNKIKEIEVKRGETRQPNFLKLNPLGMVPILKLDNGFVIRESLIISKYLLDTFGRENTSIKLLPVDPQFSEANARISMYSSYASDFFAPRCKNYIMNPKEADANHESRDLMQQSVDFFDSCLNEIPEGPFLLGTTLTLADAAFFPWVHRLFLLNQFKPCNFTGTIDNWHTAMINALDGKTHCTKEQLLVFFHAVTNNSFLS